MIRFSEAAWTAILAADTAAGRAQALATLNPTTIEFLDAADTVIRTVTTGAWTVSGANAVPGTYTDAGTGAGTPATAVFKASGTEVMRMSCGTLAGSDYLLLANIVASVKIRRGSFAVTFLDPPVPGLSAPTVVSSPTISGVARVGETITATGGSFAGNPVPSVANRWKAGDSVISGQTGLTLTVTSDMLGAVLTFERVGTNSLGSAVATSNEIGPVVAGDLDASGIPSPIPLDIGTPFDVEPYIVGGVPPYSIAPASGHSLPGNVSVSGTEILASSGAATGLTLAIDWDIDDSEAAGGLVEFAIRSAVGGANLPFAFGHVFGKLQVPAGSYVDSDLADWQVVPTSRWPDGSLRHAIIAGLATCTAGLRKSIPLSESLTDRSGTALTESNLLTALPTTTLVAGAQTITLADLVGTSARVRTVCEGPVMSNWVYRRAITGTSLVAWFDVRLYKGGWVEILPYVSNGHMFDVATTATMTFVFTMGTERFNQSVEVRHRQRIPLITGAAHSYWSNDPQIVPRHVVAHIIDSMMVANYAGAPDEATLAAMSQSYTPGGAVDYPAGDLGAEGAHPSIGLLPQWDARFVMSGDERAYNAVVVNGYAAGRFPIFYYDETTNAPPIPTDYPNTGVGTGSAPLSAGVGTAGPIYKPTHAPSMGYMAWLLTGRWFHLETMQFQVFRDYAQSSVETRPDGLLNSESGITVRGVAWGLRNIANALACNPTSDPARAASYTTMWAKNMQYYADLYGAGGVESNALGCVRSYELSVSDAYVPAGDARRWASGFMQAFLVQAVGYAWDIEPTADATIVADHQTFRDFLYQWPTGLTGDWCYQWAWVYRLPVTTDDTATPHSWTTWANAYTVWTTYFGLTPTCDAAQTLKSGINADPVDGYDLVNTHSTSFVSGYWGNFIPALSYAKAHGASGADTGYAKLEASPSYEQRGEQEVMNYAVWSIYPRAA